MSNKVIQLPGVKCRCGKPHETLPKQADYQYDSEGLTGWWWSCDCGAVLFYPASKLEQMEIADAKKASGE